MDITGSFAVINETPYYKISNSEKLPPFFIQVASSNDIWIFLSSDGCGGLTAGRKNSEGNLFAYTTDDKLFADSETGSKTLIRANGKLWQPFEKCGAQKYNITRNIYKSCYANSVILEEINHDLKLSYSYKYCSSEKYGFVKTSLLKNLGKDEISVHMLDGLSDIMPYGVNSSLQANASTLVDAYKAAELQGEKLAIYSLTTTINDTPNPLEMLRANIAYSTVENAKIYLNTDVISKFMNGESYDISTDSYGKKCGYYAVLERKLTGNEQLEHSFILDNGYDHAKIVDIENFANGKDFLPLYADIEKGTKDIIKIVSQADGVQKTGDEIACATHYLSTLYNVMRGGTFEKGYEFDYNLFVKFVEKRNKKALQNSELLQKIKQCKTISEFKEIAQSDKLMHRMALEFMPLSFSRRHGDPSRPWNKFNIALKDENGEKSVNYEGNWRDIFQNWEALGLTYPQYYDNMVAKFVNASTIDGFNPYRINNVGIEWEKPEPENPFGGLGYWGDHQIIYLLRLLQGLSSHYPGTLSEMLGKEIFTYANVPYIIKDYEEILKDSKNTIVFDFALDEKIEKECVKLGSDAKLLMQDSEVYTVSLAEKLLVPVLSKISNLLPGGGIWMNAQRPEWNDANNAIVGIGLSMVTVYHLKAYLDFIREIFVSAKESYVYSAEVIAWLKEVTQTLVQFNNNYDGNEKAVLDAVGTSFSNYRKNVYKNGFSTKLSVENNKIIQFVDSAINVVDYTISKNKSDVYVSYNLLNDDFSYTPMKNMLEGQSAVIGSGYLNANEVCELINSMRESLFDENEKYHTLYPVKKTTKFFDKNSVLQNFKPVNGIIIKDISGNLHFSADIISEEILRKKCSENLLSEEEVKEICSEYERIFAHKKFNGRSDVMYKFEGIGCVYWHQNAKFALGVLESALKAHANGENTTQIYKAYNELLEGFIYRKSPKECKAIPIEPYSHTSFNKKSEQPGMTGQVKESVIMRRGELGVIVKNGQITFESAFLRPYEFDENNEINFTCYGLKCKYIKSQQKGIKFYTNDKDIKQDSYTLSLQDSKSVFDKTNKIISIEIYC